MPAKCGYDKPRTKLPRFGGIDAALGLAISRSDTCVDEFECDGVRRIDMCDAVSRCRIGAHVTWTRRDSVVEWK